MKIKCSLTLFVSLWCISGILFAQSQLLNPNTGQAEASSPLDLSDIELSSDADPFCTGNTFWSFNSSGIQEWVLEDDVVLGGDYIIQTNGEVNSIAWCEYNGEQVFIGSQSGNGFAFYNTATESWETVLESDYSLNNAGGFGAHLYFTSTLTSSTLKGLFYYDGQNLNLIDELSSQNFILYDLPVDAEGRAWVVRSGIGGEPDSLIVYGSDGTEQDHYEINFSTVHTYGAFVMDGTIYIGFGESGVLPNSLAPLVLDESTGEASLGDPISFPNNNFLDLAACAPEEINATLEPFLHDFTLAPNPTSEQIAITFSLQSGTNLQVQLYDAQGQFKESLFSGYQPGGEQSLVFDVSNYPTGAYYIQFLSGDSVQSQVFSILK